MNPINVANISLAPPFSPWKITPIIINNGKINNLYTRKDLNKAKNITNIVRAFHHSNLEKSYYYNSLGKKIELEYY